MQPGGVVHVTSRVRPGWKEIPCLAEGTKLSGLCVFAGILAYMERSMWFALTI